MDGSLPFALRPVPARIFEILQTASPASPALRFRNSAISPQQLLAKVRALAGHLESIGIGPDARVGLCMERCPEYVVSLLALWWVGAAAVPLDPECPRERLLGMCEMSALDLILGRPGLQDLIAALPFPQLLLNDCDFAAQPGACAADAGLPDQSLDRLAYILFTSGSSGTPKGVRITQRNLATQFAGCLSVLPLPAGMNILAAARFGFDIAFFELLAPLLTAGTIILADQYSARDPEALCTLIAAERVDVILATPGLWHLLCRHPWHPGHRRILALATGEALPRATAATILAHPVELWNLYGPTECTIWASAYRVQKRDLATDAPALVSIGTALPGYSLQLASGDDSGPDAAAGSELLISGAGVGAGYCGRTWSPFPGRDTVPEGAYHSGDLCVLDRKGLLHFRGRCDGQVKHNGYRIELEEIALQLQGHPSIAEAVCLLRPVTTGQSSRLYAFVVFTPGLPSKTSRNLNGWLARMLPEWMLPQRYFFLSALPLNANGKLDRGALLALDGHGSAVTGCAKPPQDPLDAAVSAIFCEVLECAAIGPCDSFFDAGGNSMLAATLVMRINDRLGAALTLRQTLQTPPTVAGISRLLRNHFPAASARISPPRVSSGVAQSMPTVFLPEQPA